MLDKSTTNNAQTSCRKRRAARRSFKTAILGVLTLVVGAPGCSSVTTLHNNFRSHGMMNDFMTGYRNKAWCAKAWHKRKNQFCREKHLGDFCDGFKAGYQSVVDGGDGCTPAFPPNSYYGWKYQSAEGQAKMSTWFSGYPHGVRAAEEDGVGYWTQIPTYGGGQLPGTEANGLYPIAAKAPVTSTPANTPISLGPSRYTPTTESGSVSTNLSDQLGTSSLQTNVPYSVDSPSGVGQSQPLIRR